MVNQVWKTGSRVTVGPREDAPLEPHYFPLSQQDVHLFDFQVFPQYRGRGMNPLLVSQILRNLAEDGPGRVYRSLQEWNQAQLSSLGRTPFRRFGRASKWTIFRKTMVFWSRHETIQESKTDDGEVSLVSSPRAGSGGKFG